MSLPVEIKREFNPQIPTFLPHDKVFLIQVGYKLFKIGGASLLSDAPSYFTAYFSQERNSDSVLHIDRNPLVFEKIYAHLQGYHIDIKSEDDFVHILLDSFYFGLNRLQELLQDYIFANIGGESFKIPRTLFVHTGNYPNYFLIHYESLFNGSKQMIALEISIRPPPQLPPSVPNRSLKLFSDLLELLRGNTTVIRDDDHRALLVKECKYYRLGELEQRILKHKLMFNPLTRSSEIIMNLNDLHPMGISSRSTDFKIELPVEYCRPYVRKEPKRDLIIQMNSAPGAEIKLILNRHTNVPLLICTNGLAHTFIHVFKKVAPMFADDLEDNALGLLCGLSGSRAVINGKILKENWYEVFFGPDVAEPDAKRQKSDKPVSGGDFVEFRLTKSLWKVLIRGDRGRLHAVQLEGLSSLLYEPITFL